ncbi:hypothetical protein BDW22DRAFT_444134 [Trametopsis cervina]|nr:hypothetical protein BDW22DRAFT_444134 [Trametopsis cervina]
MDDDPPQANLLVVYNPVCGHGKATSLFRDTVIPLLEDSKKKPAKVVETTHAGHAGEIVVDFLKEVEGPISIVLGSGDGTLHEIVCALHESPSGASGREINFVLVPCGTANALYSTLFPETASDIAEDEAKLSSLHAFVDDPDFLPRSAFLSKDAFLKEQAFLTKDDFIQDDQRLSEDDFLPKEAFLKKQDFLTKDDLLTKDAFLKDDAFIGEVVANSAPLQKSDFLTKDDFIQDDVPLKDDAFLTKDAFLPKEAFIQDDQRLSERDFIQDDVPLTADAFLSKDAFIKDTPSKPRTPRSLTVAKTTLSSPDGKGPSQTSISVVVASTSLHASILHDSEALRATHPGIERFKIAAQQNITRWYDARVKLLPVSGSGVKVYDPSKKEFVPHPAGEDGSVVLEGPFAYFLSTMSVDRLEPTFRITPLHSSIPPSDASLDVVILRPLRDKSISAESDRDREVFASKSMAVLGGAYRDGAHINMRYSDGGDVVEEGEGEVVAEYFRCSGWEWIPNEKDPEAHLVCIDGEILKVKGNGKATCNALESLDGYKLAAYV